MPKPVPVAVRQVIVERHEKGETLEAIAAELEMSFWTVRNIWRGYRDRGEAGLRPDYGSCGRKGVRAPRKVYRAALWLKRAHPTWGAGLIRVLISERWPGLEVPHERTLQRWFRAAGLNRASRQRFPRPKRERGQAAHDVWQMDAKERIELSDDSRASWLMITDERTGAALQGKVFPPGGMDPDSPSAGAGGTAPLLRPLGIAPADTSR